MYSSSTPSGKLSSYFSSSFTSWYVSFSYLIDILFCEKNGFDSGRWLMLPFWLCKRIVILSFFCLWILYNIDYTCFSHSFCFFTSSNHALACDFPWVSTISVGSPFSSLICLRMAVMSQWVRYGNIISWSTTSFQRFSQVSGSFMVLKIFLLVIFPWSRIMFDRCSRPCTCANSNFSNTTSHCFFKVVLNSSSAFCFTSCWSFFFSSHHHVVRSLAHPFWTTSIP